MGFIVIVGKQNDVLHIADGFVYVGIIVDLVKLAVMEIH